MSYRGRPSKGCESCRARKVKCDETKPSCNRCSKSGHDCKYRDQADLLFRNQTALAAQKAEDSWRKRSKSHQRTASTASTNSNKQGGSSPGSSYSPKSSQQSPTSFKRESPKRETAPEISVSSLNLNSLAIGLDIQPDLRRQAYERFLYDFVAEQAAENDPGGSPNALWDFIPVLYDRSQEGSCFATVIDALSYFNFAARCNAPHAQVLAEEAHGRSLQLIHSSILDKNLAPTDEALGSVLMMSVYETLATPKKTNVFSAHKDGANALLQLRSLEDMFSNSLSTRLYEMIFWQTLVANLANGTPPQISPQNIVLARQYLPGMYSTYGIHIIHIIHNTATLHATWTKLKTGPKPTSNRLELRDLLRDHNTPEWQYDIFPNIPEHRTALDPKLANLVCASNGAPDKLHGYCSLRRAWVYSFYRCSRIILLRDLLEIMNAMLELPVPPYDPTRSNTKLLDTASIQMQHDLATTNLATFIEKASAAVISGFTTPVQGRNGEDIMCMRGYVSLWSLGVMNAVLRDGLIPDIGPAIRKPSFSAMASQQPSSQQRPHSSISITPQSSFPSLLPPLPFFKLSFQNPSPFHYNAAALARDPAHFPRLPSISGPGPDTKSLAVGDGADRRPSAPNAVPAGIDVAARREWIQRLLYYLGAYLGVRKAFAPLGIEEGVLEKSRIAVEAMIGKP
ncbi:hypothetical protein B0J11DRAFT_549974 [Dendryphion nanum]|uniref:Zn(2)-C6 fungal-type domain-containing protein n=1 Tax=Dendryphion nanum TaxID=256645 RepID=A0A9P9DQZ7_9PLEO|nr:hypothetical protein B0J11DRAFT_549974 [Dendryphion nanum]